jgi:hypothetical protein
MLEQRGFEGVFNKHKARLLMFSPMQQAREPRTLALTLRSMLLLQRAESRKAPNIDVADLMRTLTCASEVSMSLATRLSSRPC